MPGLAFEDSEIASGFVGDDVDGAQIRLERGGFFGPEGKQRALGGAPEDFGTGIVGVHDAEGRNIGQGAADALPVRASIEGGEKPGLVVSIGFQAAVEFEVFVSDVQHDRCVESDVPQAVRARRQTVRGGLDDGVLHAVIAHLGQGVVYGGGFGRRLVLGVADLLCAAAVLDRGNEARFFA
jgi:hypothetical protein